MTETEFNEGDFLKWLSEDVDGYYVEAQRVHDEWPGFFENYELLGATSRYDPDTETIETPVRDYRQAILYGQPLD